MRVSIWLTVVAAVVVVLVLFFVGRLALRPTGSVIEEAAFTLDTITPNADGDADITLFSYSLNHNAFVTLAFTGANGQEFIFRDAERRPIGDYRVEFSGVVDGWTLPGEEIAGEVQRRLMPDGEYTWTLTAEAIDGGETDTRTGTLTLQDGDTALPELMNFTVSPESFTPNQDGIRDRTQINLFLTKDAALTVYLEGSNGQRIYVAERLEGREPGEAGRHIYDYEGGVDLGSDPPPDGTYTVVAEAQDAVGQRVVQTAELTMSLGGKPLAEIVPQPVGADVVFDTVPYTDAYESTAEELGEPVAPPSNPESLSMSAITMPLGDVLVFKLTIENYSDVPIRTTGPAPGTVYDQNQRAATIEAYDESGAWRVGIDCDTAPSDYPWRWAVGTTDDLIEEFDEETGNTFYYLPAGERSVVWGGIRMTELTEARNPQFCWAGLIHEDVEVSLQNSRVGAREIELVDPEAPLYADN